jgi:hypothetical protein
MTKFADQLFTDLMAEYRSALDATELPRQQKQRSARPAWLTGGVATAVALVTTVSLLLTTGGPAYAVTKNADGTITFTLNQLAGAQEAAAALRAIDADPTAVCELDNSANAFSPQATNSVVFYPTVPKLDITGTMVFATGAPKGTPIVTWVQVNAPPAQSCAALEAALNARAGTSPAPITNGEIIQGTH